MCLILSRTRQAEIPAEWITNALDNNPDGWGAMWADSGQIRTLRSMQDSEIHLALDLIGPRDCHLHFRYATHGTKSVDNCHPFLVAGDRYAVMHNGVISGVKIHDKERSDTYHFAHDVIGPTLARRPQHFGTPHLQKKLERMVGKTNKLVILRQDGATMYLNKPEGVERLEGKVWLSNSYSVEDYTYRYAGTGFGRTMFQNGQGWHWAWEDAEKEEAVPAELWDLAGYSKIALAEMFRQTPWQMAALLHDHLARWVKPKAAK